MPSIELDSVLKLIGDCREALACGRVADGAMLAEVAELELNCLVQQHAENQQRLARPYGRRSTDQRPGSALRNPRG